MNALRWLRENINVDMMALQKLAIGACRKYGSDVTDKWYEHVSKKV